METGCTEKPNISPGNAYLMYSSYMEMEGNPSGIGQIV